MIDQRENLIIFFIYWPEGGGSYSIQCNNLNAIIIYVNVVIGYTI